MTDLSCINRQFVLEISKNYYVVEENNANVLMYKLTLRKKTKFGLRQLLKIDDGDYLTLCDRSYCIDDVLEIVKSREKRENKDCGNSYLCIIPIEKPDAAMCTQCNGKSFVHFIFIDVSTNKLVLDKVFYYSGGKTIKELMKIYSDCFFGSSDGELWLK